MTKIHLTTYIAAPPQRCFDLSRNVDLHQGSMEHSGERAVGGVTQGLLELGDEVTWEARHLGFARRMTARITAMDPPQRFVDEQARGPFRHFRHVHTFASLDGGTLMTDEFEYSVPFGPLGAIASWLVLARYKRKLLLTRNAYLSRSPSPRNRAETVSSSCRHRSRVGPNLRRFRDIRRTFGSRL